MSTDAARPLLIRPLRAEDEAAWWALWSAYLEFYETRLPEEIFRSTFDRLLSADPVEFHGLIAELEGQAVGLAHFVFHRSCWSISDNCYLQDLYVLPDTRGQGVGRALIEAVYAAADAAGHAKVYWQTQHFNEAGRRLYDRVGELSDFIVYERPRGKA